jgi:hypothetical protein
MVEQQLYPLEREHESLVAGQLPLPQEEVRKKGRRKQNKKKKERERGTQCLNA